ncbi:MAG: hypothetical protein Q7R66_12460 [Undibacterium sp.]|uniref:hypothetical protein n=1 Tax=Undibacterium sp. TaxID=1914977 RepID=UPI00272594C5|nr:hypothetical protein [Undibacterium sp.]MDO8652993.1 hypothetical protein [Undibacterium sp.]
MRFNVALMICASALLLLSVAQAQQPTPISNSVFAKPLLLRGKLGKDAVQMQLQPKVEDIDSVEGSYRVLGDKNNHGNKILLAGEINANKLSMEESEDGVDVSGQWDGELTGTTLRGVWQSDDGKISQNFVLELVNTPVKKRSKSITVK